MDNNEVICRDVLGVLYDSKQMSKQRDRAGLRLQSPILVQLFMNTTLEQGMVMIFWWHCSCVEVSLMMSLQLYIFAKKSLRPYITGTFDIEKTLLVF